MKIIIPEVELKVGGALHTLAINLTVTNSQVDITTQGSISTIDDENARAEQKVTPDEATILSVLAVGGEIEDYLHGIRAPISGGNSIAGLDVPDGVPQDTFIFPLGNKRTILQWFANNAEVWKKDDNSEIIFYNNPLPSGGVVLKASESELIRQMDTVNISFMTVEEVQTEVVTGWTKL